MDDTEFEIVTVNGQRQRYNRSSYRWQFGLQPGYIDREDKRVVEILTLNDEEDELVYTYTQVIAVGYVSNETCLTMPREIRFTECPRCGFCEPFPVSDQQVMK